MASNTRYKRTYKAITSEDYKAGFPLDAGSVIALSDADAIYYDIPKDLNDVDGEVVRRKASSIKFVEGTTLPETGEYEVLYVLADGNSVKVPPSEAGGTTTTKPHYQFFMWDTLNNQWFEVANNDSDNLTRTTVADPTDYIYFTGSRSGNNTYESEVLIKNSDIYLARLNGVYTLNSDISGNARTATDAKHAERADVATQSEKDIDGKALTGYIYGIKQDDVDGHIISLQKGDGEYLPPITTVDTTYDVFTSAVDGLVPATSKAVSSDSTNLVLTGSGWLDGRTIQPTIAASAINDDLNQKISDTYIKNLDIGGDVITYTIGNGNTNQITLPIEHYQVYAGSATGLVPPDGGDTEHYLSGSGTWEAIKNYSVFTESEGMPGLVPYPAQGTPATNVLSATGEWIAVSSSISSANLPNYKLYLLGAMHQSEGNEIPYTNSNVYIDDNHLYSNNKLVATVDGEEALTNKTYEGYTLGDACASAVSQVITGSTSDTTLPTAGAVVQYVKLNIPTTGAVGYIAPDFGELNNAIEGDYCIHDGSLYRCVNSDTSLVEFNDADWTSVTVMGEIVRLINSH